MHRLDHIVLGASSLDEGTNFLEKLFDLKLSDVGYHNSMGTHNRVVKISKHIYLELIAIDPKSNKLKHKRWFNLDNPILQKKLCKSPQIIGFVIENENQQILKYYDPFFKVSRANYFWDFAMPSLKNNLISDHLLENGIIPSLINWKSKKPISNMKDNKLELEKFEIEFTKSQVNYKNFLNYLGEVEKLSFVVNSQEQCINSADYPKLKITIGDKHRNIIISL